MTPLRNKMIRELELHRKAPGTIKQYVAAVAEAARHIQNAVIVHAALNHHISFELLKASRFSRFNAFQYVS